MEAAIELDIQRCRFQSSHPGSVFTIYLSSESLPKKKHAETGVRLHWPHLCSKPVIH